jgi:hypothetical protein
MFVCKELEVKIIVSLLSLKIKIKIKQQNLTCKFNYLVNDIINIVLIYKRFVIKAIILLTTHTNVDY